MIVCSCHVLSSTEIDRVIREAEITDAADVHPCFGCAFACGRCQPTLERLIATARACDKPCAATCPLKPAVEGSDALAA